MKRKLSIIIFTLILFLMFFSTIIKADETAATTETNATPVTTENTETSTKKESAENIKAKIIETGEVYERENGSGGKETVQKVKLKILNGEKSDEKFDSEYVLSYDMDNKIIGNKLRKGSTVYVKVSEESGEVKVTIQDVQRQGYLIGLIIFFFASIILVGRKKGVKAIIGLIITILAVFFVLLAVIFKGYNAVLVSIGTCFLITVLTFAVIGGWNKKTVSAALGTIGGVVLAGILATVIGYLAQLSGAGKEEAVMLSIASKDVVFNFRELLFAEIIVSA